MINRFGQVNILIQAVVSEIYYISNHWNFISNHCTSLYLSNSSICTFSQLTITLPSYKIVTKWKKCVLDLLTQNYHHIWISSRTPKISSTTERIASFEKVKLITSISKIFLSLVPLFEAFHIWGPKKLCSLDLWDF